MQLRAAGVLPPDARWRSSPEPKAHQTAGRLRGGPVELVDDLAEQRRGPTWWPDPADFAAVVRRSVRHPDVPAVAGWETSSATRRRVGSAVRALLRAPGDLVLVGHGTAWTLLVADLTGQEPDLAAWQAMAMPDVCVLEVSGAAAVVRAPWGSGGASPS